ncbi:MAG: hypothetical protein QM608_02950 [Caulobacter sp.]
MMMRDAEPYRAVLAEMPAEERRELEALVQEVAEAEIDPTDAAQWEALATVFALHAKRLRGERQVVAAKMVACMQMNAHRLREGARAAFH